MLKSLPEYAQEKYIGNDNIDLNYSDAPNWSKQQAEKYITIINETKGLKGEDLKQFIENWNSTNDDCYKTSYSSLIKMRKRYFRYGINGLLSQHGKHLKGSSVPDKYFDYFKSLYLLEGAPSLRSCWAITLGYAIRIFNEDRKTFPSYMAFKRRLDKEVPKSSIYLAREGQAAWNRKYGNYIDRDYSNITCNQVWVSDHAQIDVACFDSENRVVFPWVTVWRDFKSGKWLGWLLHTASPNSDHIFQSFYFAAQEHGLPKDVIIDNGKDYRSKDFAGGRKNSDQNIKTSSMLKELDVDVHFALPYNAQTKPIERDFLKIKELLSKHCIGYRGGNVVERPEKLNKEIKLGKLMPFDNFKNIFDEFIINVLNKYPSRGKNLRGLSPDELFDKEVKEVTIPSKDALKLFCMRTSKNYTIRRNGIKDATLGIHYWSDWMISKTGVKVYLRRDVENYKEAWVFKADNDEFIGKTTAIRAVASLFADEVSKDEFKEAMSIKKRQLKIAKEYIQQNQNINAYEKNENYKAAFKSIERTEKSKAKIARLANTNMDKVIRKEKELNKNNDVDLSVFLPKKEPKKPLFLFETAREIYEESLGMKN